MSAALELIPSTRQRVWGVPAVANFVLGGLGSGFYLAAVTAALVAPARALSVAAWLGPALVLAGFAAVASEAGRPWRGVRVLTRLGSSWMSRELLLGGLFATLALGDLWAPAWWLRGGAALAALLLALAQGLIVREARAVAAWSVGAMPVVFLTSALLSGGALLLLVETAQGAEPGRGLLGAILVSLVVGLLVWRAYLTWSPEPAFARATRPLRESGHAVILGGGGYVVPFVLAALGAVLPEAAWASGAATAVLVLAGQVYAKWLLILTVAELRPLTLANLRRPGHRERRSS